MDFTKVSENLKARGYTVQCFSTARKAADYLNGAIDGRTVAFGGSVTLDQLGLYERLGTHNRVLWHQRQGTGGDERPDPRKEGLAADVYLTSVNALTEDGELLNIDRTGNRLASILYGPGKVCFVVGRNKLCPTYEEALRRARNVAAPQNVRRLGARTPCAAGELRCHDCKSPDRICRGLVVLWEAISGMEMEVVLIDEELGV